MSHRRWTPSILAAVLLLAAGLTAGCRAGADGASTARAEASQTAAPPAPAQAVPAGLARVQFQVKGMTCGGCAIGTRAALRKLDGVRQADASYERGTAWAVYDPARVSPQQMITAIAALGYTATIVAA